VVVVVTVYGVWGVRLGGWAGGRAGGGRGGENSDEGDCVVMLVVCVVVDEVGVTSSTITQTPDLFHLLLLPLSPLVSYTYPSFSSQTRGLRSGLAAAC
jgi:hypothetical protein